MQLDGLVLDKEDAVERLKEYEGMVKTERTIEDEAIAAGYRAAARGCPVINLPDVLRAGGMFDNMLPKLAVVRADAKLCTVQIGNWSQQRSVIYGIDSDATANRQRRSGVQNGVGTKTVAVSNFYSDRPPRALTAETLVPLIPPRFRPTVRRLSGFHILWEVEEWKRVAPVDPALLRHIRGDLWSVHAVWDLTPLERAVLSARPRSNHRPRF